MSRIILVIAISLIGGWYVLQFFSSDNDHLSYATQHETTIEMINDLEPTAAGKK